MTIEERQLVGNDAGWHLEFFTGTGGDKDTRILSCGAADYYASIDASLPGGLDGGSYVFVIEGMTNDDYQKIGSQFTERKRVYCKLYMYWRDSSGVEGYLTNITGLADAADDFGSSPDKSRLVATIVVKKCRRRVGTRRYEVVVEGTELVHDLLAFRPSKLIAEDTRIAAAKKLAEELFVKCETHEKSGKDQSKESAQAGSEKQELTPERTGLDHLRSLEQRMAEASQQFGRGMFLIRDGKLHIGPGRTIETKDLDSSNGLIHVEVHGRQVSDPNFRPSKDDDKSDPESKRTFELLCKGRPDLKPGDQVTFFLPKEDSGLSASPASFAAAVTGMVQSLFSGGDDPVGDKVTMYITGVSHQLSRQNGFTTVLRGIEPASEGPFDKHTKAGRQQPARPDPDGSPEGNVVRGFEQLLERHRGFSTEIGEVRATTLKGTGKAEPPNQTLAVWRGLQPKDGRHYRARRLGIERDKPGKLTGVPYATPFAWGRCGLVLPRYPGTRVVLAHHHAEDDDPIDIGALWESGHGPDSEAGDWWLILPAEVDANKRKSLDDKTKPEDPTGKATNDLIDADGNRVIEVGKLRIQVGKNSLQSAGTRPAKPSDDDAVVIEHKDSKAVIKIDKDGVITIESAKGMNITAKGDLKLDVSGDIDVKVSGKVNVHG